VDIYRAVKLSGRKLHLWRDVDGGTPTVCSTETEKRRKECDAVESNLVCDLKLQSTWNLVDLDLLGNQFIIVPVKKALGINS
jgi:hypothetical protein